MIVVIDNYDSFTYNVVQALQRLSGDKVEVLRSKECTVQEIANLMPTKLVISPGPGNPSGAGISLEAIRYFAGKVPILGVCLGHQAIAQAFGARIVQAKNICHGVVQEMTTDGKGLFRIVGKKSKFTRYHSLAVEEASLPPDFEITARAPDGEIMGIRHKTLEIEGVQFHPESIASEGGDNLFRAFLNYRREDMPIADFLKQLISGKHLTRSQASLFIENLTDGTLDERAASAILTAMACLGEPSADEMAGCAEVLLKKKTPFPYKGSSLAEIVGTGGDGKGSFNISSLSALTAVSCGQPMAKHGNRAVSSKSGAADFFEAMGFKITAEPEKSAKLLEKTGFAFLMAPIYHPSWRFAGPIRKALGIKTIFNVLGPLVNPAGADYAVLGVYSHELMENYAHAAKALGSKRVMVVCSEDGYDEISPCKPTHVFQIDEKGKEYRYIINPADFGITDAVEDELLGGTGVDNARLAEEILSGGGRKTIRYAVGLNTAAVLYLSGKARTLKEGYAMALEAIDSGRVRDKVEEIRRLSNE